jgi:hypothetical protein
MSGGGYHFSWLDVFLGTIAIARGFLKRFQKPSGFGKI